MTVELLTPLQAAERLNTSTAAVRQWANDGRIEAVKLPSGRWRISASAVEALLAQATADTAA